VKTIGYDGGTGASDGNIKSKSDLGAYAYGQGAGPHAVTSVNTSQDCTLSSCMFDGISNPNIYYDADGNMTTDAGRSAIYTSFDMASSVGQGNNTTAFAFTPEHERGSRTSGGVALYYLNNPAAGLKEELLNGSTPQWATYLIPYGHLAGELFTISGTITPYYLVGDHLESITALSDANGNPTSYYSYDAWGRRRNTNGSEVSGCQLPHPPSIPLRGYTSQEMIDTYCLVDLNARNYDSDIGRMMSADPMTANPANGQAFNHYSYVLNEPLVNTDPSGDMACDGDDFVDPDGGLCKTDAQTAGSGDSGGYYGGGGFSGPGGGGLALVKIGSIATWGADGTYWGTDNWYGWVYFGPAGGIFSGSSGGGGGGGSGGGGGGGGSDADLSQQCVSALALANRSQSAVVRANASWSTLTVAAESNGNDPALLASIGVQESNFQTGQQAGNGSAYGVFQIDLSRNPGVTETEADNLGWAADWTASYLSQSETYLVQTFPDWTPDQVLQGTAASYNLGRYDFSGNQNTIDVGSTGGDYGSSVVNLMSCFKH